MEKEWLSAKEVMEYLGISRATVARWSRAGKLPKHKIGKITRYKKSDLDKLLEEGGNL